MIVVTGMHRSGTSLVSSFLQISGLDIGKQLLQPEFDNPKGYFEDKHIVQFHQNVLNRQKIDLISPQAEPVLNHDEKMFLREFNADESYNSAFKDPRAVLFLEYWASLRDDTCFIFIFRHPALVIDSLIRRNSDSSVKKRSAAAAKGWLFYNERIRKFYSKYKERSIIFNIDDVISYPSKFISAINEKFGIIIFNSANFPFDSEIFSTNSRLMKSKIVDFKFRYQTRKLYRQLQKESEKLNDW